jgi:hypothetical protein
VKKKISLDLFNVKGGEKCDKFNHETCGVGVATLYALAGTVPDDDMIFHKGETFVEWQTEKGSG